MFGKKKAEPRTCARGHALEETWEQCPFCAAEDADAPPETLGRGTAEGTRPVDPGEGAVVVPRKAPSVRSLAGWLVVTDGEDTDRDHRLHTGPNVLGKDAECDVVIKDSLASARHAIVHCRNGQYTLEDLDSKHGTLLDDRPLHATQPLHDGGRIRVGGTEFRFRSYGD